MQVSWTTIKDFVTARGLSIQYVATDSGYLLAAADGYFMLECTLPISDTAAISEFEAGLKLTGNKAVKPLDSDGSELIRTKTTKTGWHFEPRSLDFYTAKYNSLYNKDFTGWSIETGTDINDATLRFFNSSGTELVKTSEETAEEFQTRLSACTVTYCDWEPHYTLDLKGLFFQIKNPPTNPAYIWLVGAPDIPAYLGGQVCFGNGGWNLAFFAANQILEADGGGVKGIAYDPVYHSGKIRAILKHEPGTQIGIQLIYKQYKA